MSARIRMDEARGLELASLPTDDLATTGMGRVRRTKFFGSRTIDPQAFGAAVRTLPGVPGDAEKLAIFSDRHAWSDAWLFGFHRDRTVTVARLLPSKEAHAWWTGYFSGFADGPALVAIVPGGLSGMGLLGPDPRQDLAGFLAKQAPSSYRADDDASARRRLLAEFEVTATMRHPTDVARTTTLWSELLRRTESGRPGASPDALGKAQAAMAVEFPEALAAMYAMSDGADHAVFGRDVLSLDAMVAAWRDWKAIFDDWTVADLFGDSRPDGDVTMGMYTNPRWLPLVPRDDSHFLAVDLMPGPGGRLGQIIHFGSDQETILREAPDLTTWLEDVIAGVRRHWQT